MLNPTWNPFSSFADRFEVRVERLLRRAARLGVFEAQRQVLALMQENVVMLNLYMEARLKGYKYLTSGARKTMYKNAERTGELFLRFTRGITIKDEALNGHLRELGLVRPSAPGDGERLRYLAAMMAFLQPGGERYQYLEGASFGKLLGNIEKGQKMIGDCNQIVTFYVYLYSLRYDIDELQIKLLPGHVCLHYRGLDIEATAGNFANHAKYEKILPIVELLSTNLLDVSDFRDKQFSVNPREFLKGAQLAFSISSEKEIVSRNLQTAYHNVAVQALQQKDFETAEFFLQKAGGVAALEGDLLQTVYNNAVVHYSDTGAYDKARFFADKAASAELRQFVNGREYNALQTRVAGLRDITSMKSHRGDYEKMLNLAIKMEDSRLAENLRQILKQL